MPCRSILLSVLACLCLVPDAALAAPPTLTKHPLSAGSGDNMVDPSAAILPDGRRLFAATNADTGRVHIWEPNDLAGQSWSNTALNQGSAKQPAIAWNGGPTAFLRTASSQGCASPRGLSQYAYAVGSGSPPAAPGTMLTWAANSSQSWPRVGLRDPGDENAPGDPITVTEEETCVQGGEHRIIVSWPGTIPQFAAAGRYPDVAVLGTGLNGQVVGTRIIIAYLTDAGGSWEVRVRDCLVSLNSAAPCTSPASEVDAINILPGTITPGGFSVTATAAPSIACAASVCHVAWTEGTSNGRTRVFHSRAAAPYTSWSAPEPVADASTPSNASQLMPSVAARGTRADVIYLDTRSAGGTKFDTYQTSLDTGPSGETVRGRDISLTGGAQPYAPIAGTSLGQRTEVGEYETPGAAGGIVAGYFPDGNGGIPQQLPVVSEALLAHGTAAPILPAGAAPPIGKNTSYDASNWLAWSDADGDPVTLTVDDPAHGSFGGGIYTPDPTYVGADTVTVRASTVEGASVSAAHAVTVTNQQPTFDAPAPAIVDEGGATVTVPLHAVDPDALDTIVYSVISGDPLLTSGGRATIVNAALQLKIPSGVRAMAPLQVRLRARDTTTGAAPLFDDQDLSVTIRPDLRTPTTVLPISGINVTGIRVTMTAGVQWDDPSSACLKSVPLGCHVRRVWNFGDGSTPVTTMDVATIAHNYPRAGAYAGQVTTWVLWGASLVASPPKSFHVAIQDDGRVLVGMTPKPVKILSPTKRQVRLIITPRASGSVWLSITVGGKLLKAPIKVPLVAGKPVDKRFNVSIRGLKSRRATVRLYGWGGLAAGMPQPTSVYRSIILR